VIQIHKLRDSRYSPRMYFFNVDDNSAALEDIGRPATLPEDESA
jgi:hypothetical protein